MLHWKAFGGLLRGEGSVRIRESGVAAAMAASAGGCIVNLPGPATFAPLQEHLWAVPFPGHLAPHSWSNTAGVLPGRQSASCRWGAVAALSAGEVQSSGSSWASRSYRFRDRLTPLPAKASRRDREKHTSSKPTLGKGQFKEKDALDLLESIESDWLYMLDEDEDLRDAPFLDAVVKVYCTHTEPNFSLPWQKQRQYSSTGSGFMIAGRRLLTNAHCVEHHTQVKVKRRGDDTKFVATVLAIGPECDIALLSVEDDEFWKDVEPLRFGSLPHLQDDVTVVGYPVGGDTISVTSGVVSRIEVTSYVHGAAELLAVQIDAAINPGNSGGPAFNKKGECVGIAFQTLKSADTENIGWVIPTPVVAHFLTDFEQNLKFTGFPCMGILWQKLENPAMREFLQMKDQKGVLVRKVEPTSPSSKVLKQGDVLLKFDGVPIANEGTVPFRGLERISFGFLVSQKFSGDAAKLEVLRNGEALMLETTLKTPVHLVPVHIGGRLPSYYIVAGFVFTPVCQPFLESEYGGDYEYTAVRLLEKAGHSMAQFDDEQLVVVSQVLANDVNIGYEEIANTQILAFNGTKIRNLKQLAELVDSCTDAFLRFELDYDTLIVLESKAARASISQVLLDHGIPSERSPDLIQLPVIPSPNVIPSPDSISSPDLTSQQASVPSEDLQKSSDQSLLTTP